MTTEETQDLRQDPAAAERKIEKDYSAQVDTQLPQIDLLAQKGQLTNALDQLLLLEKLTRVAADQPSNSRILLHILNLLHSNKNYKLINDHIVLLSKKHGFLKNPVQKMVQLAITFIPTCPDEKTRLDLIDVIRVVTEGKIFVEVERARVTRTLSKIKEEQGNLAEAAEILQELQVETFGSMDKREKADFILEQMRLSLAKMDYVRVAIISKKISAKFFADEANHDLLLRFADLMIRHALQGEDYLAACKLFRQIYETKLIKDDDSKLLETLSNISVYIVMSPYNNEQSDLIHRIYEDPALVRIPAFKDFMKCFITNELMRWAKIEEIYGPKLQAFSAFQGTEGAARWKVLHKRNIRVLAKYYTRISMKRITQLLDLPVAEAETFLSNLVVSKTVYARIDRPRGVVTFKAPLDANSVLNEWAGKVEGILDSVVKTNHLITKEEMVQEIVKVM